MTLQHGGRNESMLRVSVCESIAVHDKLSIAFERILKPDGGLRLNSASRLCWARQAWGSGAPPAYLLAGGPAVT